MELPTRLKELLNELGDYTFAVPDELTDYALRERGFDCKDVRTTRLVSLAATRFLAGVLEEAGALRRRRMAAPTSKLREQGLDPRDKREALAAEDLIEALQQQGVNASRPPYYHAAGQQQQPAAPGMQPPQR